jgi:hypothetical protein
MGGGAESALRVKILLDTPVLFAGKMILVTKTVEIPAISAESKNA